MLWNVAVTDSHRFLFIFVDTKTQIFIATLVLDIQDKKLKFFKNLIQHFSFVKIQEPDDLDEDTDEQVRENIREGVRQMRLVEQEKMKSRPVSEFLEELNELETGE